MPLYCLFYPLRLYAYIPLRDGGGAVLKQSLHKGNVIAVIPVNLRCVPLAEAVGADTLIAEVVTDARKDFLDL